MSERRQLNLVSAKREPLFSGGGGPDDPGTMARISRLEDDIKAIRSDGSATRADVAYIRGRLETLPTTWQMITTILGTAVAVVGMLIAAARLLGHS